jgi:RES domain
MTAAGCPWPECPVPDPLGADFRHLHTASLDTGRACYTSSWGRHWPSLFNGSGRGDSRFSPLSVAGKVVPVLYAAWSQTAALLETVFHDIHQSAAPRLITRMDLAGRNLVEFTLPGRVVLYDLRDEALPLLSVQRHQLVSTTAAHYPCTREWAEVLHARKGLGRARPAGLLWNSRVAELAKSGSVLLADLLPGRAEEVFLLFGDQLATTDLDDYAGELLFNDLSSVAALPLVSAIAEQLGAIVA